MVFQATVYTLTIFRYILFKTNINQIIVIKPQIFNFLKENFDFVIFEK